MVFNDETMKRYIDQGILVISPFEERLLQPASIDLQLAEGILVYHEAPYTLDYTPELISLEFWEEKYCLKPKQFALASTLQYMEIPYNLRGRIDGKSSLGRQGLVIQNAGYFDPGFKGTATLELFNFTDHCLYLTPGQLIAQISFDQMVASAARPYGHKDLGSHYQGQKETTPNWKEKAAVNE